MIDWGLGSSRWSPLTRLVRPEQVTSRRRLGRQQEAAAARRRSLCYRQWTRSTGMKMVMIPSLALIVVTKCRNPYRLVCAIDFSCSKTPG